MHLWGQIIAKHLRSIITDDSQKFGNHNPLFLRRKYRQGIGAKMVEIQRQLPNKALDGEFIGVISNVIIKTRKVTRQNNVLILLKL
jgi:hypothetical protein